MPPPPSRIAIVGGGLAGLAAAVGLADRGLHIELLEARRQLGGRAGSFRDPASGELVDHCQHVSLGCCTNLDDFCRRTGLMRPAASPAHAPFLRPRQPPLRPRRQPLAPRPAASAPLAACVCDIYPGSERLGIIRALRQLARASADEDTIAINQWLRDHGQTDRAIELFWAPVIVSALSETPDRAAVPPVRKVFVDAFLGQRHAYEMQTPAVPLGELYGNQLEQWLSQHGVTVRRECGVKQLIGDAAGVKNLLLADGQQQPFDAVIVAVPWRRLAELLSDPLRAALPELREIDRFQSAPITAVHLWFDRPITDLPHAVLPGRISQWVFRHGPQYYQVVISASRNLADQPRDELIEQVRRRTASHLARGRRSKTSASARGHRAARRLLAAARQRTISPAAKNQRAQSVSRRRLDRHRLARHHGRRRPQRLSRRRSLADPSRQTRKITRPRFAAPALSRAGLVYNNGPLDSRTTV